MFNGPEYVQARDCDRLMHQHERIRSLMCDGHWRTLAEIAAVTGDPESSISAQLRHLRKPRFGSFVIERSARGDKAHGLYQYRLRAPGEQEEVEPKTRRNRYKEALEAVITHPDCPKHLKLTALAILIK